MHAATLLYSPSEIADYIAIRIFLCYYTTILTSTSPSEIADSTVLLVYFYATILLYLPLLHRVKLLIISLYQYLIMLLYYYTYL